MEPDYQPLVARLATHLYGHTDIYMILRAGPVMKSTSGRYFPSPAVGLALPLAVGASIFALLLCRAAYLVR